MSKEFPLVELSGAPFDMGFAHGRALAGKIKENLAHYTGWITYLTGTQADWTREAARKFIPALENEAPELLEEMQGIAKGAEVSLEDVLFINARSELLLMSPQSGLPQAGECTAVALAGNRTESGRLIMGQNWDWYHSILETSAVFHIKPSKAPAAFYLAEAGQVGKIGINEAGVGVLINILMTGGVGQGIPFHVLLRMVLAEEKCADAAAMVKNAPRAGASHLMIGDANGDAIGIEISDVTSAEIKPDNGLLIHTNHYCDPDLAPQDLGKALFVDSEPRYNRAQSILAEKDIWDEKSFETLFVNHEDGLPSICRHVDHEADEYMRVATLASVIMVPDNKTMRVTYGNPCDAEYSEYKL